MSEKLGLALGGGAARGWAHIGVIQVLEEAGIKPDVVAGTSIGSLVGACYVAGKMAALEDEARAMTRLGLARLADVQIGKNGFLGGDPIARVVRHHLGSLTIEDLPKPYAAVATDLTTGKEVVQTSGDLVGAIRASISIPGVFTPIRRGTHLLVDGGLVNNIPVSTCKNLGATKVIAVNITGDYEGRAASVGIAANGTPEEGGEPEPQVFADEEAEKGRAKAAISNVKSSISKYFNKGQAEPSFMSVSLASMALIMRELGEGQLRACPGDVTIEPHTGHVTLIEFDRADELIACGREATLKQLDAIKALVEIAKT